MSRAIVFISQFEVSQFDVFADGDGTRASAVDNVRLVINARQVEQ